MGRATLMASGKFGSFAMDNSQFKIPRKYQREGVSSAMAKFTTRCAFKVKNPEKEWKVLRVLQ